MTIQELDAIRSKKKALIDVRRVVKEQGEKLAKETGYRKQVLVCGGTGCTSSHSMKVIEQLEKSLKELGIKDVLVVKTGCFGLCALGPIMIVYPEGAFYIMVDVSKLIGKTSGGGAELNCAYDIAAALLAEKMVAAIPCESFGAPDYIRLSYAISDENIKKGLERIKKFVDMLE